MPSSSQNKYPFDHVSQMSKDEFLQLVAEICSAEGSEEYQDELIDKFIQLSEHPSKSDLIFWPAPDADDTPEGIVAVVENWRAENNLPPFKQ